MFKLNSKGQGAMEYLMTYAWAILVVLIVGVVLYQMGIFSQSGATITTTGFTQLKLISQVTSYDHDGNFQASLLNTLGTPFQVTDARIEEGNPATVCTAVAVKGVTMPANVTVNTGEAFQIIGTGCNIKQLQEPYYVHLNVSYTVSTGNTQTAHVEYGTIQGKAE